MQSDVTIRVVAITHSHRSMVRRRSIALPLAFLLLIAHLQRPGAENHADYRYEDYKEDDARMHIRTHAVAFGFKINSCGSGRRKSFTMRFPERRRRVRCLPRTRNWLQEIHPDTRNAGAFPPRLPGHNCHHAADCLQSGE